MYFSECLRLKLETRKDRQSKRNGVVAVIQKVGGSYDWLKNHQTNIHGTPVVSYKNEYLFPIIYKNHCNSQPEKWHCPLCKTYAWLDGSYIEYIDEETFLNNPAYYIENAYNKSENDAAGYDITPTR